LPRPSAMSRLARSVAPAPLCPAVLKLNVERALLRS
jgi:hypothetical protein